MAQLKLTLALSHYDRHIPLFDGSVPADGVDLKVLEVGQSNPLKHGQDRHERMLQKGGYLRVVVVVVFNRQEPWHAVYGDFGFSAPAI